MADGMLLCSGDMLLQALVACAGVTLRAVATSLQIDVADGTGGETGLVTSAGLERVGRG